MGKKRRARTDRETIPSDWKTGLPAGRDGYRRKFEKGIDNPAVFL